MLNLATKLFGMMFGTPSEPKSVSKPSENLPALHLAKESDLREELRQTKKALAKAKERDRQYPLVAFTSRLAQGVTLIPGLDKHFEFFREENRMCIIMDWYDAEGIDPKTLVPAFLEIDTTQQVTSTIDNYKNTRTIIFKIPIRGWDESVIVLDDIDQQGTFGLSGKAIEKSRPFTCVGLNVQGFFRREDTQDGWWCNCYFFFEEVGNRKASVSSMLPPQLQYDNSRTYSKHEVDSAGPKLVHYRIPIVSPTKTNEIGSGPKRLALQPARSTSR